MKVGLAVTTFNRAPMLGKHLRLIKSMTASEHVLVVCNDGSSDDTNNLARQAGADIVISGQNRGIAWNKNRGIFYLHNYTNCDIYILLDDDVYPRYNGWDLDWAIATKRFGHVNFCRDKSKICCGALTADEPGLSDEVAGACIAVSREAVSRIGYFDVRFGKYGHEHSDLSFRSIRAGLGGVEIRSGEKVRTFFYVIEGGVNEQPGPSHVDYDSLAQNLSILYESSREDLYRNPWRTDVQRRDFLAEVTAAYPWRHKVQPTIIDLDEEAYLEANPDVRAAGLGAFEHYVSHGVAEGRPLRLSTDGPR